VPPATFPLPPATPTTVTATHVTMRAGHGKSLSQLGRARILWYLRMIEPRETKLMVFCAGRLNPRASRAWSDAEVGVQQEYGR
jgi:hypothetical protein